VFAKIDADLSQPIVVVQHMPAGFTAEFAKSLDRICPLEVKEAAEGDLVKPGRILIAPGDKHIEVEKKPLATIAHLSDAPPVNGHRPSADVLFASVARQFGNRAMGVIMTGMGRDGARELGSIYSEGGLTLGQDEASSVVYGMPKVAFELGHVMEQVPLSKMAEKICQLAKEYR
jgi:two-component system chemotaxis response regulator CheB